jgi:KDO2-lipid IV(A) lauroyltransferase
MGAKDKFRYFLEYLLVRAIDATFRLLPERLGRAAGRALGRAIGLAARSRTRLAVANMRAAFPGTPDPTLRRWARRCWANLGEAAWEFSGLDGISPEDYFRHVDVEGVELLRASHAKGKGVILFTAHYTNWELTSQFVTLSGFPLAVIGRRIKNPFVNDFVSRRRSNCNITVFLHKQAVRESIRWLKNGGVVGMLIDQRITDGGMRVPFLGRPAHTTGMPALLALRLGCPVHPVNCWREEGRIRLKVWPAMDFAGLAASEAGIAEATARLNRVVEGWVRERPPMWLWIHDRWK